MKSKKKKKRKIFNSAKLFPEHTFSSFFQSQSQELFWEIKPCFHPNFGNLSFLEHVLRFHFTNNIMDSYPSAPKNSTSYPFCNGYLKPI